MEENNNVICIDNATIYIDGSKIIENIKVDITTTTHNDKIEGITKDLITIDTCFYIILYCSPELLAIKNLFTLKVINNIENQEFELRGCVIESKCNDNIAIFSQHKNQVWSTNEYSEERKQLNLLIANKLYGFKN